MKNFLIKILSIKFLRIFVLFTMLIGVSFFIQKGTHNMHFLGVSYNITDAQLLSKINLIRRQNGLSPLIINGKLSYAASLKANDMLQKNYWSHFSPTGASPWYFIANSNYRYVYAGENLAKGYTNTDEVFNAWMNSESHKNNILSRSYTETGFAVVSGNFQGQNSTIIVEMFGSRI